MESYTTYADSHHPSIHRLARRLLSGTETEPQQFQRLFDYVQNRILFGFPPSWDLVYASETLEYGMGYCNTKSILLHALCKAAEIEARLHVGMIQTKILKHILPLWSFPFIPENGPHLWLDVLIDNHWYSVDAYVLDKAFTAAAIENMQLTNCDIGYGIAFLDPGFDGRWNDGFVQSNAVTEDLGYWEDAGEFFADPIYQPMNTWQTALYPVLRRLSNANIDALRARGKVILKRHKAAHSIPDTNRPYAAT